MYSLADSGAIFSYHREMMKLHGPESSYALGWRDQESQLIRFEALTQIADLNGHSVLDAGCGYADLLPFLLNQYPQLGHYTGVEQIPELLDEAIKRHATLPDTRFISGSFINTDLPLADYVMACGSLNYRSANPAYIFKAIAHLYTHSRLGLAFNLLRQVTADGLLIAYQPEEIVAFCQTMSKRVVKKDDYAEEDFTIYLYH